MNKRRVRRVRNVDAVLLALVVLLVLVGFFIFLSASLGLMARGGASFSKIASHQFMLGVLGGAVLAYVGSRIPYKSWRALSPYLFVGAIVATLAVFIPGLGMSHGGATRWIDLRVLTLQPAELLKIAAVLFAAHIVSAHARAVRTSRSWHTLGYFGALTGAVALPLLLQPDTGTVVVIVGALGAIFFAGGMRWRDVGIMLLGAVLALGVLAVARPYVFDRITTFIDPTHDARGSGYQVTQSLIAVGSGQWLGRGFGQSVQKFNYLPEPIGDSVFAVFAEEFGFVGSVILLALFTALLLRMYYIATKAYDMYGALVTVGIATAIMVQSLFNIAAMLAVVPLSGLPLIFVSHGGTALALSLFGIGIVLNISRYRLR